VDSIKRFSSRVENYQRFRPSYPLKVIDLLITKCDINATSVIADVGAGTGIFTKLLLKTPARVIAVEPNNEMRAAINPSSRLEILGSTAENTGLAESSVDLLCAAQAFHWFDPELTRKEFSRILKKRGWISLLWNTRKTSDGFMKDYDKFLDLHNRDYREVVHTNPEEEKVLSNFADWEKYKFSNVQMFDLKGLIGRYLSSSYAIPRDDVDFPRDALKELFERWQKNRQINFEYTTEVFLGRLE